MQEQQQPPQPQQEEGNKKIIYRPVGYRDALIRAKEGYDLPLLADLCTFFQRECEQARKNSLAAQSEPKERRADDAHLARLRHILSIYTHLASEMRRVQQYFTQAYQQGVDFESAYLRKARIWHQFEDHQVLSQPHMGSFSLIDQARLLEGDDTHLRGIAGLSEMMPDQYGIISPEEFGWSLRLNRETYPMTGEELHRLLVLTGGLVEPVPFSQNGVLPTTQQKCTYDGMSVVLSAGMGEWIERDGETHVSSSPTTRLSLKLHHYKALVLSVAYSRYGIHEYQHESAITQQCFGRQDWIPDNEAEVEFWWDNCWFSRKPDHEKERYFGPGYKFAHYPPAALEDFDLYAAVYRREKERKLREYGRH